MSAEVFNNYFNRIVKIKEKIKNMNFVLFIMLTSIKCSKLSKIFTLKRILSKMISQSES